ncbi:MAG: CBS domain-containing protein [Bdellovibrio bacteriovorus]
MSPEQTAAEVVGALRQHHHESLDILCVVDPDEVLLGIVPIARLLALHAEATLGEVMERGYPRVPPDMDQERMASLALHHALTSIPVIDHGGRLLGVVPPGALLRILRREHVERTSTGSRGSAARPIGRGRPSSRRRSAGPVTVYLGWWWGCWAAWMS